jgi:hypothetical protein
MLLVYVCLGESAFLLASALLCLLVGVMGPCTPYGKLQTRSAALGLTGAGLQGCGAQARIKCGREQYGRLP